MVEQESLILNIYDNSTDLRPQNSIDAHNSWNPMSRILNSTELTGSNGTSLKRPYDGSTMTNNVNRLPSISTVASPRASSEGIHYLPPESDQVKRQRIEALQMSQHAGPPSGGHNHMQGSGMLTQPTSPNATVMKYPLRINNSMVLHRPGQIMFAEPAFHTRNAFYPINYCLLRLFQSLQDPTRQGYWRCEVLYHPGCPVFRITEDSAPANSFSSRDIDQVVADLRLTFQKIGLTFQPPGAWSGLYFFGLSNPVVISILETLPGADRFPDYSRSTNDNILALPPPHPSLSIPVIPNLPLPSNPQNVTMSSNQANVQNMQNTQQRKPQQKQPTLVTSPQPMPPQRKGRQPTTPTQRASVATVSNPIPPVSPSASSPNQSGTLMIPKHIKEQIKIHRATPVLPKDYPDHMIFVETKITDRMYHVAAIYSLKELLASSFLNDNPQVVQRFWEVLKRCFVLLSMDDVAFHPKRIMDMLDTALRRIDVWSETQLAEINKQRQIANYAINTRSQMQRQQTQPMQQPQPTQQPQPIQQPQQNGRSPAMEPTQSKGNAGGAIALTSDALSFCKKMKDESSMNDSTVERITHLVPDQPFRGPEKIFFFDLDAKSLEHIQMGHLPSSPSPGDNEQIMTVSLQMFNANNVQSHGQKPIYLINVNGIVIPPKYQYREAYHINKFCRVGRNFVKITNAPQTTDHPVYIISVILRRYFPVNHLLRSVIKSPKPSTTSIINAIKASFNVDSEVEQISLPLSLRCPITRDRMILAGRSTLCRHVQPFCLLSFLRYSVKMPRNKWICPVCHTGLPFNTLYVDEYVQNILNGLKSKGREEVEQVSVDREGVWATPEKKTEEERVVDLSMFGDDIVDVIESTWLEYQQDIMISVTEDPVQSQQ
ncbi:hypothetical protein PROFUN_15123 [Planoprotostelium fungivorum]|uniref:SP-RING-type domain-containing protein n=1 Tax=Planoprotostelium fungivorum TaxID=1890364 RepID=A0A2P6MZT5_9EUKA|nr:hypothetical protein PROFUN_15123 [Planoprotostelium fungivorum]